MTPQPCVSCGKLVDYFAANPALWPMWLPDKENSGVTILHCFGCVMERLDRVGVLEAAIRKHRDQRGDDRCWIDNEELYAVLPEGFVRTDLALHTPEEMLPNCKRFLASCQPGGVPYVSPQREIERLEAEIVRLQTVAKREAKVS